MQETIANFSRIGAAAMLALGLTGAAMAEERTPDDPRLVTPRKLTVGTGDPVYPPWMLNNDPAGGEGFENGLVYALAEEMGFDRPTMWSGCPTPSTRPSRRAPRISTSPSSRSR